MMTQHKSRRIRASSFTKLFQLSKVQSLWRRLSPFLKPRARSDPHLEIDMANATSHSRVSTRTLAMALMAVAIAASLAACGGGGGVSSTPEQAPATLPTTPVAPVVTACDTTIGAVVGGVCIFQGTAVLWNTGITGGSVFKLDLVSAQSMTKKVTYTFNTTDLPLAIACVLDSVAYADGLHVNCKNFVGGGLVTYALGLGGKVKIVDTGIAHGSEASFMATYQLAAMPQGCDASAQGSYTLVASGACFSVNGFKSSLALAGKVLELGSEYGVWSYGPK